METKRGLKAFVLAMASGLLLNVGAAKADTIVNVDQGWGAAQKATWYTLSQGSRLLPLSWLQALEQANSDQAFLTSESLERFRYLPNPAAPVKGLPVGFAIDRQDDSRLSDLTRLRWKKNQSSQEPWVGMNCAACHTNELTFQGRRLRIEGAPTLADFSGFIVSLNAALTAARDDPSKWSRFAQKVLGKADNTPENQGMLRAELGKLIVWQQKVEDANASPLQYGFGRLDAFGHIFNKVLLRAGASDQAYNPANAPVSYPFLWNIPQHDKVQWNGIVDNGPIVKGVDIGALGRNVGEVTGVFADVTLKEFGPAINGYPTSAVVKNLITLEKQLATLKPPAWPSVFPAIDAGKWARGEKLFQENCHRCHAVMPRNDLKTPIKAVMTPLSGAEPIGTDPWMACNAYTSMGKTGVLGPVGFLKQGTPKKFFVFSGPGYGEAAAVADLLTTTVIGSIWNQRDALIGDFENDLTNSNMFRSGREAGRLSSMRLGLEEISALDENAAREQRCMREQSPILAYKGRPLNGIWATPPYLHNGSVPSLMDLLLPPSERVQLFFMGTREFDPVRVGYVTDKSDPPYKTDKVMQDNAWPFKTHTEDGKPIPGNANSGHDYGNAGFRPDQREALVEYMKAVGGKSDGKVVFP